MATLFIPPEGAHQFEFKKGRVPDTMRKIFTNEKPMRRPEWVWVGPAVPNQGGCKCKFVYPVLIDGLPDDIKKVASKIMSREIGYAVECNCRGSIIE